MTISRLHLRSGLVLALAALTVALAVAIPSAHAARATARPKTCDISKVADRLGPTSVTSLKVLHLRCDRGIAVVRAFHACRLANGVSGRCVRLVKGYACNEQRTNGPTQFSALVSCAKGRARVTHRYTQVIS
jgi:hypothetical protein